MGFEFFIGIDVSKNELDFAVVQGSRLLFHREAANTPGSSQSLCRGIGQAAGF